jgi:hypothetical protein
MGSASSKPDPDPPRTLISTAYDLPNQMQAGWSLFSACAEGYSNPFLLCRSPRLPQSRNPVRSLGQVRVRAQDQPERYITPGRSLVDAHPIHILNSSSDIVLIN